MFVLFNNGTQKFIGQDAKLPHDESLTSSLMDAHKFNSRYEAEQARGEILKQPGMHPTYSILEWM